LFAIEREINGLVSKERLRVPPNLTKAAKAANLVGLGQSDEARELLDA
jgi:hypothetical protein